MSTSTKYTYFVNQDFPNKIVSKEGLSQEINQSDIVTKLDTVNVIGNVCDIWFVDSLSTTDDTILDALVAAHEGVNVAQVVQIKEEDVATGGHFKLGMFEINATRNTTTTQTFSFDIPINIITARIVTGPEHAGDSLTWSVSPNTTVGALTQNYTAKNAWVAQNYVVDDLVWYKLSNETFGRVYKCIINTVSNEVPTNKTYWTKQNTTINVNSTVTTYTKVGFNINLTDGTNTDEIGIVVSIDTVNGTITVNGAPQHNYNYTTPTYVQMSIVYMDNVKLGPAMNYPIGQSKTGSSYVPAGTIVLSKYVNNSADIDKNLYAYIEYLY